MSVLLFCGRGGPLSDFLRGACTKYDIRRFSSRWGIWYASKLFSQLRKVVCVNPSIHFIGDWHPIHYAARTGAKLSPTATSCSKNDQYVERIECVVNISWNVWRKSSAGVFWTYWTAHTHCHPPKWLANLVEGYSANAPGWPRPAGAWGPPRPLSLKWPGF